MFCYSALDDRIRMIQPLVQVLSFCLQQLMSVALHQTENASVCQHMAEIKPNQVD